MSDMVGRENLTQLKESLWADVYNMGVSINGGTPGPQSGWFVMENPHMMILGYPHFRKPPYSQEGGRS